MTPQAVHLARKDCIEALSGASDQLKALSGDTVVITGGTGFIGSWLTEMLTCLNDQFGFQTRIVLISRSTDLFKKSSPHLANRPDVTLVKSDIRNLIEVPKETNWLIHAAATPDTRFHAVHPIETMSVIAEGTSQVLKAVDRCGHFKMMLNLSSGLVYGSQPQDLDRIPENYNGAPTSSSASSAYAESKRYAETLCAAARSQARIPVLNVRPFAFIGPYQSLENPWAINNFIRDALQGGPISVLGDGQSIRSYLYGSDMAFWILRILTSGKSGQTFNLGSPEGVSLESLAHQISSHFTPHPEIRLRVAATSQAASKSRFVPDVTLARENLGLKVSVSLKDAIQKTILWNRET